MRRFRLYAQYPSGKRIRRRYKSLEILERARGQMWEHNAVTFNNSRGWPAPRGYVWRHITEAAVMVAR